MLRLALQLALLLALGPGCQAAPAPDSAETDTAETERSAALASFPEAGWLASEQELLQQLTTQPLACLNPASVANNEYQLAVGRAAFNTPALLGGQAARMGLSCASCHRNGQDNPQFFIAGISGAPGTLDVTHGFFSEVREDGQFNPVSIPSLLDVAGKKLFGSKQQVHGLEAFVHGVIVDEFAGREPAPEIMAALLAYVSALDSRFCNPAERVARTLQTDLQYLDSVIVALGDSLAEEVPITEVPPERVPVKEGLAQEQSPLLSLLVLAAQTRLQEIYLRFPNQPELAQALATSSRELRTLERTMPQNRIAYLKDWNTSFKELRGRLQTAVSASLYQL